MELELDDGLFWLPNAFLNDDDDDENMFSGNTSDLSSPVESVFGTESDEEDYLNDLSRKLAQSTLDDDNRLMKSTNVMAGSPQSTLRGYNGIENTRISPAKAQRYNELSSDALRIAAGEVARLGMLHPKKVENSNNYHFHQIHAAQLKQQQLMKQQQLIEQQQYQYQQQLVQQNRAKNCGAVNMKPMAAPFSAWPTLQQYQAPPQPGTGMRAVFLGNPNLKRESTGTGVFLPRQIGAPTDTRKKKGGCSTVLLPDKVIHALNLNLDAQTRTNAPHFPNNYDAEMGYRKNVLTVEQEVAKDLRLPKEWTY